MNLKERLRKALPKAMTKAELDSYEHAKLGRLNADYSVTFAVPGRPDFTYVTKADATVTIALNRGAVPLQYGLPVKMRLEAGVYVIYGRDRLREAPGSGSDTAYAVPPHPHAFLSLSDVLPTDLADGQIFMWDVTAGKMVNVDAPDADVAAAINAAAEKATLHDDDRLGGTDSEASGVLAWWKWSTIRTAIANYLATMLVTAIVRAASVAGVRIEDDGGNLGILVLDGGRVVIGTTTAPATHAMTVAGPGVTPEGSAVLTTQTAVLGVHGDGHAYFMGRDVTNDIEFLVGTSTVGAAFLGAMTDHDLLFRAGNGAGAGNVTYGTLARGGNWGFNSTQFGSGTKVYAFGNASVIPTTNPTGGGVFFVQAGAAKWRGSSGTVTTFGPAEPHCPVCGADYVVEYENEQYGYFVMCLRCLAQELGARPWINWQDKPSGEDQ
ncbi:MAG: hypothetical protein IT328_24075 [Caldilineaceae bacterium]|nr:hypothetical protein [Caldilineaceae bacterium]